MAEAEDSGILQDSGILASKLACLFILPLCGLTGSAEKVASSTKVSLRDVRKWNIVKQRVLSSLKYLLNLYIVALWFLVMWAEKEF